MLGEIARWLRILGYDTLYSKDLTDQETISTSKRESRVLLTSDEQLHKRAMKEGVPSLLLKPDSLVNRLVTLARTYGLELLLDPASSKCPICNGAIKQVTDVGSLRDRVPEKVYSTSKEFWICTQCHKIYWVGGHWKNITRTINEAKHILSEQTQK